MPWVNGKWVATGAYEDAPGTGPAYTGQKDFGGYGDPSQTPPRWDKPVSASGGMQGNDWENNDSFQEKADPGQQYRGLAGQYRQWDPNQPDWTQRDADIGLGNESRGAFMSAINMAKQGMSGQNSIAQQQLRQQTQQGLGAQGVVASSARGGGLARAAAQRNAVVAGNNLQANAVGQNALLGAKESEMYRQQYAQQTNKLRAQDLMQKGMSAEEAMKQADMELEGRLGAGQLGMQYEGLAEGGRENALNRAQQAGMNQASVEAAAAKRKRDLNMGAVGAFTGAFGGLMQGIGKAAGKPKGKDGWDL